MVSSRASLLVLVCYARISLEQKQLFLQVNRIDRTGTQRKKEREKEKSFLFHERSKKRNYTLPCESKRARVVSHVTTMVTHTHTHTQHMVARVRLGESVICRVENARYGQPAKECRRGYGRMCRDLS